MAPALGLDRTPCTVRKFQNDLPRTIRDFSNFRQRDRTIFGGNGKKFGYILWTTSDDQFVIVAFSHEEIIGILVEHESCFAEFFTNGECFLDQFDTYTTLFADMSKIPQKPIADVDHACGRLPLQSPLPAGPDEKEYCKP